MWIQLRPSSFPPYTWQVLRPKGQEVAEGCFLASALAKVKRGVAIPGEKQRWARARQPPSGPSLPGKAQGPDIGASQSRLAK